MNRISEAFGGHLRVRVCALIIQDDALLLTEHTGLGPAKRLFIPPGGGMAFGETAEECLVREVQEETGLLVKPGKLLFIHEYLESPLHALELFFSAEISGGKLRTGYDPELETGEQIIVGSAFMNKEEIEGLDKEMRHQVLKRYSDPKVLQGLRGYFRFD